MIPVATRSSSRRASRHPAPPGAGCFISCALAAAFLLAPVGGRAEAAGVSVEAGPAISGWDYAEYGPTGVQLDRERGFVPGAAAAAQLDRPRWFARCEGRASDGTLRYRGRTQSANAVFDGLPVTSTSDARFLSVEARAGARLGDGGRLAAYGGAAWRGWRRSIRPTTVTSAGGVEAPVAGLRERYGWAELHAGARWSAVRTASLELAVDARLLATVLGEVAVDRPAGAVSLGLAPRPGARVAAEWREAIAGPWYLAVDAHAAIWAFGASAVDVRSGLHEPDSVTRTFGLEARVGARF